MRLRPGLVTSAVTRAGVTGILPEAARVFGQASRRIPTGELNKLFEDIVARHPPPAGAAGRHVRLYFATQAGIRPPTFFVSTNHPAEHRFHLPALPREPVPEGLRLRGARPCGSSSAPTREEGRRLRGRGRAQKIFEARDGRR